MIGGELASHNLKPVLFLTLVCTVENFLHTMSLSVSSARNPASVTRDHLVARREATRRLILTLVFLRFHGAAVRRTPWQLLSLLSHALCGVISKTVQFTKYLRPVRPFDRYWDYDFDEWIVRNTVCDLPQRDRGSWSLNGGGKQSRTKVSGTV